jgi:glucose-1-phosphate thymidylyltransferase
MSSCTTKAVVLARGLGSRMRREDVDARMDSGQSAVADTGIKAMIPVGRPFLDYVLSALADAGCRQICLVVAPDHEAMRRYYHGQIRLQRLQITFAVQREPRGTADAVTAAESFAADDSFLMVNSDNYYPVEALRQLRELDGAGVALFQDVCLIRDSNIPAERVRHFAIGRVSADERLECIVEKPAASVMDAWPTPHWVSMNCWQFRSSIFRACRSIPPSKRGELELADAVQYAIDCLDEPFLVRRICAGVLDMTCRRDVADVARRLADVEVVL